MGKKEAKTRAAQAGILLSPARVSQQMRKVSPGARVGGDVDVFLAGALEYIATELILTTGEVAIENKKTRITRRLLGLVIRNDQDFAKIFRGTEIAASGVTPHIQPALLPPKRKATAKVTK